MECSTVLSLTYGKSYEQVFAPLFHPLLVTYRAPQDPYHQDQLTAERDDARASLAVATSMLVENACVACRSGRRSVLWLPCMHLALCSECKLKASATHCPVCKMETATTLDVKY